MFSRVLYYVVNFKIIALNKCLFATTAALPCKCVVNNHNYRSDTMFSCTALHRELLDYSLRQIAFAGFRAVICHHTAALPCKRVVNKRL